VLLLYPFRDGEQYIQYDALTHRATLHNDPARAHLVGSNKTRELVVPDLMDLRTIEPLDP
jgi:hypothetical protein